MAINEERSYTEYNVEVPTTDFPIGFDILDDGIDVVAVTLNDVDPTTLGYTVTQVNSTTYRFAPAVPSGVVRLTRITDIDQMVHVFTEGAIFVSENMDNNFKQIRHAQQEVRDGFNKLSTDTNEIIDTLQVVGEAAQDAAAAAEAAAELANDAAAAVNDKVSYSDLDNAISPIKDYTALPYVPLKSYKLYERVQLENGDIVKSTVANNIINPNVDMAGWDYPTKRQEIEKKSIFTYMTSVEFFNFLQAPPRTFDFTAIINRTLAEFNTISGTGTRRWLYLPAIKGGYKTTDTLWCPKYTGIIGDGGGLWQYDTSNVDKYSSDIFADFSDPYKFVISSDTRLISNNTRIPYSQLLEGNLMDGGTYSWSDGIKLKGFRINTASRIFGGIKLIGSVGSFIDNDVTVTGCDYGYVTSACWDSTHIGSSLSYKCGYLGYDALNGTVVEGYHNNNGAPTLLDTNLINFFQDGYSLPYALMNTPSTRFGVVLRKSFGVSGRKLIAEGSMFPIVAEDRCQASFGTIYAEKVGNFAVTAGNQCQVNIGNAVGGLINGVPFHLGTHAKIIAHNYSMVADIQHIDPTLPWGDTAVLVVPSRYFPEYHQNIVWNDKPDNVVYLSPTGSDKANGASYYHPTNITQAIKRIATEKERYDRSLTVPNNKSVVWYLTAAGTYTLNTAFLSIFGRISIRKKSILDAANVILNMDNFVYLSNCVLDINGVTLNIPNKTFDSVTYGRNAPFIANTGINSLVLASVNTVFNGTQNGIVSYGVNSEALCTLNIKGGSITGTGDIVQRAETVTVGNSANVYVGESCAVDATIKAKTNGGINLGREQQGIITVPWLLKNASVIYDPPSLATGLQQSTTVTLLGAKVGDPVDCSFSNVLNGTRMWAEVTALNTVTVYHRNDTGATVDLTSGTLSVKKI